jgi:hypothetical protein
MSDNTTVRLAGVQPLDGYVLQLKWQNGRRLPGDLDMGAARLWELSLEQNGHASAAEFIRWRWRHGLSLSAAAEALGISRRQVAYYASGEEDVPRYILLACKGWEAQHDTAA